MHHIFEYSQEIFLHLRKETNMQSVKKFKNEIVSIKSVMIFNQS